MISFISLKEITKQEREKFDCGNVTLNEYFFRYAKQDEKKLLCKCYVAKQGNDVIGFFTLSAASVCLIEVLTGLKAEDPTADMSAPLSRGIGRFFRTPSWGALHGA